ncbi:peptide MFS transporter [Aquabacter spiritensis]|uniref:POT family proton-dependent oligopeptide transporter n=1 Tax=Aquabacter spiritensis TaxID=933073 RepID=A0A4R3M567_9HYPH|nr:peptide MFS transporter [Aquabacter spiritensis]TCT07723.1 POT family proton-dependent oligopeptide transporter [Aquabacter spiritensis]
MSVAEAVSVPKAAALRQPRGLVFLFAAEMWERFSFYGMQALIVLYMVKVLGFGDARASLTYGAYAAFVFLTPIAGGLLADRVLGFRRAVIVGGVIIMAGHIVLALPFGSLSMFLGMAFVVVGTGFFKSSVSAVVGQLYGQDDPRRDGGFTIFYMGINVGALLATLIVGYVGQQIDWHLGFGLAAIGMAVGLVVFVWGSRHYAAASLACPRPRLIVPSVAAALLAVPLLAYLLAEPDGAKLMMLVGGGLTYAYVVYRAFTAQPEYRRHLVAILIYVLFASFFWALFKQKDGPVLLLVDRAIDRHIFGFEMPSAMFTSFNPFMILILAPLFARMWSGFAAAGRPISTEVKFFLGLLFAGGCFALIATAASVSASGVPASLLWIVAAIFLLTCGELALSPVGLSMITALSPPTLTGLMFGAWFLSTSFGAYAAGWIGTLATVPEGAAADMASYAAACAAVYFKVAGLGLGAALVFLAVMPWMRRLQAHG